MPKRLLVITQKIDETDDLLGFFASWVNAFAQHYDRVDVITLARGPATLASNVAVYSLGKERGVPKWQQAMRLVRLLWQHTPHNGAVFAHMSPIFAIVAWPFARLRRAKLELWYLHRSHTARLRLAVRLCDKVLTADTRSLTIKSPKIVAVGHGIDLERFAVPDRQPPTDRPLHVLSVGRLSPIKNFETLIRASKVVQRSIEVRIVGKPVMAADHAYAKHLHELGGGTVFVGFVPYRDMAVQYAWADVVVGCTPTGGLDKALLEALAAGCVVFTSNQAMRGYIPDGQLFDHGNADQLAERIDALQRFDATPIEAFRLETTITNIVREL